MCDSWVFRFWVNFLKDILFSQWKDQHRRLASLAHGGTPYFLIPNQHYKAFFWKATGPRRSRKIFPPTPFKSQIYITPLSRSFLKCFKKCDRILGGVTCDSLLKWTAIQRVCIVEITRVSKSVNLIAESAANQSYRSMCHQTEKRKPWMYTVVWGQYKLGRGDMW